MTQQEFNRTMEIMESEEMQNELREICAKYLKGGYINKKENLATNKYILQYVDKIATLANVELKGELRNAFINHIAKIAYKCIDKLVDTQLREYFMEMLQGKNLKQEYINATNDKKGASQIDENATFGDIFDALLSHDDEKVDKLCCNDTHIRTTTFETMAKYMQVPYDDIYNMWLNIDDDEE